MTEQLTNRQLDDFLAEKVMGWVKDGDRWLDQHGNWVSDVNVWNPSQIDGHALDLAEAMRVKEHQVILYFWPDDYPLSERYGCHILSTLSERGSGERQDADTLPMAICMAVKAVFEGKEKEHGDN